MRSPGSCSLRYDHTSERSSVRTRAPQIVTFSGIDGAAKQRRSIASLRIFQRGFRSRCLLDDVACLSKRAGVSLAVFRKSSSAANTVSLRHDKNVRTWYLTFVRAIFYFFDTLCLRPVLSQLRAGNSDFVIFDRYLYDQLAQIQSQSWLARAYIRLLVSLAPKPDFAFVLDAFPEEAFARKPEYPLDFMCGYRRAFLGLSTFVPQLIVIAPSTVEHVGRVILRSLSRGLPEFANASRLGFGPNPGFQRNSRNNT
jgi:hypothetical protein